MKTIVTIGAVALGLGFAGAALAGSSDSGGVRKNETYCLEESQGNGGGGTTIECMFETLEQCQISRTQGSTCMLNPRLAYDGRNRPASR